MDQEVVVYGSNWCGFTIRAVRQLDAWGVEYRYVDVDASPEDEQRIADWNNGRSIRPTIAFGETVHVNPNAETMQEELRKLGRPVNA